VNLGPLFLWIPLGVLAVVFGLFVIWLLLGFLGVGIASAARPRHRSHDL
jgi:hypothetical protein